MSDQFFRMHKLSFWCIYRFQPVKSMAVLLAPIIGQVHFSMSPRNKLERVYRDGNSRKDVLISNNSRK